MFYHFKVKKDISGFWAECVELKGCVTQGDSKEELMRNAYEALNLFLEEPDNSDYEIQPPAKAVKGNNIVQVVVDPTIAFALQMKFIRQKNGLTQKEAALRLGMKNIYSYQRLESARKANPNLSTICKIKRIFPELMIDDLITDKDSKLKRHK